MILPTDIQEAIKNNSLVVFAGSGLSTKFKLPTWRKLTEDVITSINEKKYNDLLPLLDSGLLTPIAALDMMEDRHTKVRSFIKDQFKLKKRQDLLIHQKIFEVTKSIITTNYDNAFEEACDYEIIPSKSTSNFNISEINKVNKPYVFKLHGCYTEPDNCIVFSDDYKRLYDGDTPTKEKLKSIFIDKTILFLGFSFNDPDINLIFSGLDTLFDNHNHHYILTKEEKGFDKFKFLSPIVIDSYDTGINTFLDHCIEYKKEIDNPSEEIVIDKNQEVTRTPRIAFLKPEPLDLEIDSELSLVENCLDDLNINIFSGYLNTRTLEEIDDYDILIIATKVFKDKLYIEDYNLKSDLLTTEEICAHIPNEQIPIIFITNNKINLVSNYNTINISTFKRATIRRFAFKALRNKDLSFKANEEISVGLSKLTNLDFTKGSSKISSIYENNRALDIGEKSLNNIIGRIEEQANISSKLQSILRSNKVLNIKASGGTGKTTLIKKVSYELYNRGYFKDGVSFKSCENLKSFEDFEEILSDAFNLRNILNLKDYLIENYSSRKLNSLVILDNFETVSNSLEASAFIQVLDLIKFATDFANIVITSREKIPYLDSFEDLYSLAPLTTDDAVSLFELDYGKIVKEEEIRTLRQDILEDLLNNNPLAIKLVTKSRTRFKHVSELRDQIKEHFFESLNEDFSSVFSSNADLNIERTKSIYQSINYSYATLNYKEKIAFELLSLFPDGISLSNFKKCFEKSTSSNNISDKELRTLRDKSLVEDYNGTLQLQPIIRRFADYQFSKSQVELKQKYCLDAYLFNCHILDLIDFVAKRKNSSEALKVYNQFKNNLLNVFTYIPDIQLNENGPVPEKKYLLNFIYGLDDYVANEKQIKEFYKKINSIQEFFKDLPHADTLIKVIKLNKRYYFEEFENSYSQLSLLFSAEEMEKRNLENEEYIERRYKNMVSHIHNMEGYTINHIKSLIINDNYSLYLDYSFFYLGIPTIISRKKVGFYFFEYELMFGTLNNNQLEEHIESLYLEEHLEKMQSTYTLSKIKKLDRKKINKLVVTNPYTRGLKDLMFAFAADSDDEKNLLFKSALRNLSHIKYYYLEALYFYCKHLKASENEEYNGLLNEGLKSSKNYYYQYIHHLFENLNSNTESNYKFTYSFYPVIELEDYVNKHNEEWEKTFIERDTDY
jgi:hypothetical protein